MSNFTVLPTPSVARPCPFYQATLLTSASLRPEVGEGSANCSHTCMLHAGNIGPDGKALSPHDCTAERQVGCQSHRRLRFARLFAQPLTVMATSAAR